MAQRTLGILEVNVLIISFHRFEQFASDPTTVYVGSIKDVAAVIIGGDSSHLEINKRILTGNGIPVIGKYTDKWMNDEEFLDNSQRRTKADKSLVVVPETREVLMYSKPVGYVKLA